MKHRSSLLTFALVFSMWLLLALGCASSGTPNRNATTGTTDRLAPMSANQKADVIAVMNLTDDLDDVGKNRRKTKNAWALYIARYTKAHDKFNEVYPSLPKNDARMMLYNMIDAYENVGSLMLGKYEGKTKESPDTMLMVADIRKALLKRILDSNLTPEMVKILESLREQDK